MRLDDPQLVELLAQRYVLGTQRGAARRRFASLIHQRSDVRQAVNDWEQRLMPLVWDLEPVMPSDLLWQRISRELGIDAAAARRLPRSGPGLWPAIAATFALLAVVMAGGWWRAEQKPPETVTETIIERVPEQVAVALLASDEGEPLWLTRIAPASGELAVRVVGNVTAQPANDYELWALTDAGVPVSLGLLPQSGSRTLALGSAATAALERSSTLAVSLEPTGGSPEAVPTGPVLYTAALMAL
ncbi:MAG TPA: anti-sigma factor [Gammaproteobacteria bacterium]|nr:anti-sigma factor [Gammaproteobacteria bacterium]